MALPEVKFAWLGSSVAMFIGLSGFFARRKKDIGAKAVMEANHLKLQERFDVQERVYKKRFAELEQENVRRHKRNIRRLNAIEREQIGQNNKLANMEKQGNDTAATAHDTNEKMNSLRDSVNQLIWRLNEKDKTK